MRRREREITDRAEIAAILAKATVCRLGLADGGEPYVVPLSFGYEDGTVYLHSAQGGMKIDLIRKNPRCCIEADICEEIVRSDNPCSWGIRYHSVIGFGTAEFLTDPVEKRHGLNCILQHYGGGTYEFPAQDLAPVAVIRVRLDTITGKKRA